MYKIPPDVISVLRLKHTRTSLAVFRFRYFRFWHETKNIYIYGSYMLQGVLSSLYYKLSEILSNMLTATLYFEICSSQAKTGT
jgi:hypothetical protein